MKKGKVDLEDELKKFEEGTISLKDLVGTLKIASIIGTVFNVILLFTLMAYSMLCVISVKSMTREELIQNESFINYVAKVNNYYHNEAIAEISSYNSDGALLTSEVILPTLCIFIGIVGLLFVCKYVYDFTKNVKSTKTLFTKQKLETIKQIRNVLMISSILIWLSLGVVYMLLWALLEIFMEIIIYLFSYAVDNMNSK